ncbi:MAG: PRC-barrel domain-containing protein [Candidatus Micrarchaeota archaeon]|nr:PRC-barrel domain-containing protein [Candidatus Micrarchaeota archaeon]
MALNIADLYGMDIFTANGKFVGKIQDVIVDLEKGEVIRVAMEPLSNINSREEARDVLKNKSILYKNVRSVGDVVIVDDNYKETR